MKAAPSVPSRVWSVGELLNYLKRSFDRDDRLRNIAVRGEVTDYKLLASGVRLRLREPSGAQLSCWVWGADVQDLPPLANGLEVIALGRLSIYAYGSECQLEITNVYPVGAGKLAALYERIKRKLEAEGLFAAERKRPIPRYPFSVALVSSRSADGANDFVKRLRAEAPFIKLRLVPTAVQGNGAAESIARAIAHASTLDVDVVVVARGGGSEDDRLPFNEECVARAIAASYHPVIAAIGHAADRHVADDVADLSAPTPTAAAAHLTARFNAVPALLSSSRARMNHAMARVVDSRRSSLRRALATLSDESCARAFSARAQRASLADSRLTVAFGALVRRKRERLHARELRLGTFHPRAQLAERAGRARALAETVERHWKRSNERRAASLLAAASDLERAGAAALERRRNRLALLDAQLRGSDPEAILQHGYAIVRVEGRAVRDAAGVAPGQLLEAQVARGTLHARVELTSIDGAE